jgi:hypothetical protein
VAESQRRPIILLSPPGDFYAYILTCLGNAFRSLGNPCAWINKPIAHDVLAALAQDFAAAACLEINRVLPAGNGWPPDTAHMAWIQDYRFNGIDLTRDLGASHHLYFLLDPLAFGIAVPANRPWSLLLPGARSDVLAPFAPPARCDFSFVGFIPDPLNDNQPVSTMPDGRIVTLKQVIDVLPQDTLRQSHFSFPGIRAAVDRACDQLGCKRIENEAALLLFDEILPRTIERKKLLEAVLTVSASLEIYGPPPWRRWPQFAPYYKGFVDDPRDLDTVFQNTRINLHNSGLSMHFRVLDCLAAGGFLMVSETSRDFDPGGIRNYLEPARHYASYAIDEAAAVAAHYLDDPQARMRIAAEGRRAVLASHTWAHRAAQILQDLGMAAPCVDSLEPQAAARAASQPLQSALAVLVSSK